MPGHGLNQLLNSMSVCLVLVTGLAIGAWFSQAGQPRQPRFEERNSYAFEGEQGDDAPDPDFEQRRSPGRPKSKKRRPVAARIRQAAYQETDVESEADEMDGTETGSLPVESPQRIPLRVAAAVPNPAAFIESALAQPGVEVKFIKTFEVGDTLSAPSLNAKVRTPITLPVKVVVQPRPAEAKGVLVSWEVVRPVPQGFAELPAVDPQGPVTVTIDGTGTETGSGTSAVTLPTAGVYTFTAQLIDGNGNRISNAEDAKTTIEVKNATPPQSNRIARIVRTDLIADNRLIFPMASDRKLLLKREFSVELASDPAVGMVYQLVAQRVGRQLPLISLGTMKQTQPNGTKSIATDPQRYGQIESGEYRLWLVDDWTGEGFLAPGTIRIPELEAQSVTSHLSVVSAATGPYSDLKTIAGAQQFYPSYLKIQGTGWDGSVQNSLFYLFKNTTGKDWEFAGEVAATAGPIAPGNGAWQAVLNMPDNSIKPEQRLFAIATSGDDHTFSLPVSLKQGAPTAQQLKPVISEIKRASDGDPAVNKIGADYQTRTNLVKVVVPAQAGLPGDAAILIRDPQSNLILASQNVAGGSTATEIPVSLPSTGEYQLAAQFTQGPGTNVGALSTVVKILVILDGPTVSSVVPPNFGSEAIGKEIRVTFDTPIGLSSTALADKFVLYRRKGRTDNKLEENVPIGAPELSDDKKTVIITTTADPVVDSYRLIVKGQLTDAVGNLLRGDGLTPGTDYSFVLSPAVALASGGEAELPAPKRVKFIEYPEYTKPRQNPAEFLPSDHVETRVARLYYFRDAHRVAQIINREVESLNYAATSMQKQLADKARRQADQGTDERRAHELRASQAAQAARLAENELEQEEAAAAQAEQKMEELTQAIEADQVRLSEWQADLDAMTAQPPPMPPPTPEQIQAVQQQIKTTTLKVNSAGRFLVAAKADLAASGARIAAAQAAVQAARDKEIKESNESAAAQANEDRLREDQFRREVAAANADPDTFAAGNPDSKDAVAQVSVSVIGEGVIQLRGPLTGVNKIRQMINQIDQPVGQVRISIHTAQVNGEHGDRMEKVVNRIDNYIEHARFLTTHSTEMLRQSILQVASEKAMQAAAECPTGDQSARDEKYLHAFFGEDFVNELREMDSEFLKTGNKLLSLHSMDTTSLASALFVMALAKNDTRMEILANFSAKLETDLPQSEIKYHQAGYAPQFCGDGKNKMKRMFESGKGLEKNLMALNAKFVNFGGFFNANVVGSDTLNPTQREFLKLAQIFKSRLVTEIELRQRVVERGLIEQRDPDRAGRQDQERLRAQAAEDALHAAIKEREIQRGVIAATLQSVASNLLANSFRRNSFFEDPAKQQLLTLTGEIMGNPVIESIHNDRMSQKESNNLKSAALMNIHEMDQRELLEKIVDGLESLKNQPEIPGGMTRETQKAVLIGKKKLPFTYAGQAFFLKFDLLDGTISVDPDSPEAKEAWTKFFEEAKLAALNDAQHLAQFMWTPSELKLIRKEREIVNGINTQDGAGGRDQYSINQLKILTINYKEFGRLKQIKAAEIRGLTTRYRMLLAQLTADKPLNLEKIQITWTQLSQDLLAALAPQSAAYKLASDAERQVSDGFAALLAAESKASVAARISNVDSLPLDHRRFLDFLIAETEDKYIELLEGTRSHTANIDNYIKRLITALDDDFNTQFYKPAFQGVRQASRLWDVNLGQIETTSILTNNRMFGKVSPQATMEFDLPKRDILIQEAMNASLASYQQYGALLNDPTFLSMTKLRSGQPTSSPSQRGAGESAVRSVLPGLPSATDEQILGQAGPGNREFNSPLESLIPDPAIYKFETGTGFEIRPVIQPDGQAVVFHFNYMYRTNVREPVRADEKHLGRVKQHFIDTDVQLSNFELRKVSDYTVALKTSRTSRGVPLLEDIPILGVLGRPLPSAESSLQQNVVMAQATIFPTLFDLMGLRWAPAVADLDQCELQNEDHIVRGRRRAISNEVYEFSSRKVDEFMQIPEARRREDLYHNQRSIPTRLPCPHNDCEGVEQLPPVSIDLPLPNAMPTSSPIPTPNPSFGPSPSPNPGTMPNPGTEPLQGPALSRKPPTGRSMPQRTATRPIERSVELLPAPGAEEVPAPPLEDLPPPRTQRRTLKPPVNDGSGPFFVEPRSRPPETSSSTMRGPGNRGLVLPAGGVQPSGSRNSGVVHAGYESENPRNTKRSTPAPQPARTTSNSVSPASRNVQSQPSAAGRTRVGNAPVPAARPSLVPWLKRTPKPE